MIPTKRARSADGTDVGYVELGEGPAIVVVHGGNQAHTHYLGLANALAARGFRVAVPDRRGRGLTPGGRDDDGIEAEVADLAAVQEATGARFAFGHSAGGLIVAEAAVRNPSRFDAVALYEPAIDLVGRISFAWIDDYKRALATKRYGRAFALCAIGLKLLPPLPTWLAAIPAGILVRTAARDLVEIMPTLPRDAAMATTLVGRTEAYRTIGVRSIVVVGANTPQYLKDAAGVVGGEQRVVEGADHTLPVGRDAAKLAPIVGDFFGH